MSKSKIWELKYVLLAILMFIVLVTCSFIESGNYLDALYLFFIFTCIIRYIIIEKTNRN